MRAPKVFVKSIGLVGLVVLAQMVDRAAKVWR